MTELDKTNHCPVCGSTLLKIENIVGYDMEDGSDVTQTHVTCPKNWFFFTHYDERFGDCGDKIEEGE
jgi:hypothetical protein